MDIYSRQLNDNDRALLHGALQNDEYHKDTDCEFFYAPGSVCNVYEDGDGPVLFLRGSKALRLDIQFVDNKDYQRNRQVLLQGLPDLINKAKVFGFSELVFFSSSPLLIRFCTQKLGFRQVDGELRLTI